MITKSSSTTDGFTSVVLPKVQPITEGIDSNTGVSTRCVLSEKMWFALRATYGREKKAAEFLSRQGIECFNPTIKVVKYAGNKRILKEESRLPNIFFAHSSFSLIKDYIYDNVHEDTRHLRFYYNRHHDGTKEPLVIPERQIRSLKIICGAYKSDTLFFSETIEKFQKGQRVLVEEGDFAGVEGVVARFCGQQRVGITIEGVLTATTAYVPSAFLKKIE